MAVDLSKGAFELISGRKRTRPGTTLTIALLVTAAVVLPLVWRAVDARNNPVEEPVVLAPADADLIVVGTESGAVVPLDQSTVGGPIRIWLEESDASAASFRLFASGADTPIVESQDVEGPRFDFIVGESGEGESFETTLLADGSYELFVTIRTKKEDRRTAVGFVVQNP